VLLLLAVLALVLIFQGPPASGVDARVAACLQARIKERAGMPTQTRLFLSATEDDGEPCSHVFDILDRTVYTPRQTLCK
jgi:hypothetical protein